MEPKAMVAGDLRQDPVVLEQIAECRAAIFDRTGTPTYGAPKPAEQLIAPGFTQKERADPRGESGALLETAAGAPFLQRRRRTGFRSPEATEVSEPPGQGHRRNNSVRACGFGNALKRVKRFECVRVTHFFIDFRGVNIGMGHF